MNERTILFVVENPSDVEEGKNYTDYLNPQSLIVKKDCYIEDILNTIKPDDKFQFERIGYFCADRKDYSIPESVKSIGYSAFFRCISLTSVVIPANVISIDDFAFNYGKIIKFDETVDRIASPVNKIRLRHRRRDAWVMRRWKARKGEWLPSPADDDSLPWKNIARRKNGVT